MKEREILGQQCDFHTQAPQHAVLFKKPQKNELFEG